MKVFISWSGETSKQIAQALRTWLPSAIQAVQPYFTPDDIAKGAKWNDEISRELAASQVGILCLTPDNLHSDWLLFEAGALSKNLDQARLCPLLFGVETTDLQGPLLHFQAAPFTREEMHKLFKTINAELEEPLADSVIDNVFDKWWPDLQEKVLEILATAPTPNQRPQRPDRDLLEEVLQLVRRSNERHDRNEAALKLLLQEMKGRRRGVEAARFDRRVRRLIQDEPVANRSPMDSAAETRDLLGEILVSLDPGRQFEIEILDPDTLGLSSEEPLSRAIKAQLELKAADAGFRLLFGTFDVSIGDSSGNK